MLFAELILLVFFVLVFFSFGNDPFRTFGLQIVEVGIICKLPFGLFDIESEISSFFSRYRFEEVIAFLLFALLFTRMLIVDRLLVIRSAHIV